MNIGPVEQYMRESAIAARRRLWTATKPLALTMTPPPTVIEERSKPIVRPVLIPKSKSVQIIDEVARKHKVKRSDITGPSRVRVVVDARHEAAYRLVVEMGLSLPMVGRQLGNRDHTTALNSIRRYVATHPDAAPALSEHNGYYGRLRKRRREAAIDMYFNIGLPPGKIGRELRVSGLAVSKWILDEIERRKQTAELSPVSPQPTS